MSYDSLVLHNSPVLHSHSPFFTACRSGNKEYVIQMLKGHTDIDVKDIDVNKVYEWDNLIGSYGQTVLYDACYRGDFDIVTVLLNQPGIDVNKSNEYQPGYINGDTPLKGAISGSMSKDTRVKIVSALLAHPDINVDVNKSNNDGSTPYELAIELQQNAIVKMLLEKSKAIAKNTKAVVGQVDSQSAYFKLFQKM